MKLNRREADILDFLLGKSATAAEITAALGIKKPNLSRYLKKLAGYRLIEIRKEGRSGVVSLEPFVFSGFSSARSDLPSLKLADVLVGWTPSLLAFINKKKSFVLSDIDLPPITSKRLLKRLRSIGIVFMSKRGRYELREEAFPVADFCFELLSSTEGSLFSRDNGYAVLSRSSMESARGIEVVYATEKETMPGKYWPTAFSVFDRYGIHLISAGRFYYTNIKPGIADVVIHTLALSRDARNIAYVSALMLKNSFDPRKLLKKRQVFGLGKDFIGELIKFMETKGGFMPAGFPSWKEVGGIAYAV